MSAHSEIAATIARLRSTFASGRTRSIEWRMRQLDAIRRMLVDREDEILDALHVDVGKPRLEGWIAEVGFMVKEVDHTIKHLAEWMRPEKVAAPLVLQPARAEIHKEPLGVCLVISPWNYPFQLAMAPLVGALSAGNCVLIKPSEVAPHTSALLARLLPQYLEPDAVAVIEGGVRETTELLEQQFDHIFYTGNGHVGRIVMTAAAKHLTPVVLELGGKSPCIVDKQVDLDVAARRITWGKFYNAGQTCVAPDYVLVHEQVRDAFLDKVRATVREFYGDDPKKSPDYGRIVNERHHKRLSQLLRSGEAVTRVDVDEADRYISPTVLRDVSTDSKAMEDEIFGPILPVLSYREPEEVLRFINDRPKPLALYVFSENESLQSKILANTSSGGVSINHVWLHLGVPDLPFGGVGESGLGAYHGKYSFDTFTHKKGVLRKPLKMDPPIMYPPYDGLKARLLKLLA
ncbi:MAG: aldehyde dehydrogenase family protein [Deltaproteobacteria bacterium]|nr:aldehyde dehydrogenase family protein [Deltaproteobacteria bacterium]